MLDARIASALNKIIQNSYFEKKVCLEEQKAQKEDRFLRGWQIAYMIHDYFRVTGAYDTVLDYADFSLSHSVTTMFQDFETRWDEILLSLTKIPLDDILESLYKLRYVGLINSKPYKNFMTWKFIRRYQNLKTKTSWRYLH